MVDVRNDTAGTNDADRFVPQPHNILLQGITGSHAYGLANADSDVDRLGCYAIDTVELLGLTRHTSKHDTYRETAPRPDRQLHEARKMCELLLNSNPSATELLWLPDDLYEVKTTLGGQLLEIRETFLSAREVLYSYRSFADSQYNKLINRIAKNTDGHDVRISKHCRHFARILHQGLGLYRSGRLDVTLDDPQWYREFGERAALDPSIAANEMHVALDKFAASTSPLPDAPDRSAAIDWLRDVRRTYYFDADYFENF